MSTNQTLSILSKGSGETEKLGEIIGRNLRGGEIIELSSDLGGGKTTLTKGIARGAGSKDKVASPTFMICKRYEAKNLDIYHYDFYRLSEPGIISHELEEGLADPAAVLIVEWGDIVSGVLPENRCRISIKTISEDEREIGIICTENFSYLTDGLK